MTLKQVLMCSVSMLALTWMNLIELIVVDHREKTGE